MFYRYSERGHSGLQEYVFFEKSRLSDGGLSPLTFSSVTYGTILTMFYFMDNISTLLFIYINKVK
jgi:hypothetical protein